jgi:hypothetical protein
MIVGRGGGMRLSFKRIFGFVSGFFSVLIMQVEIKTINFPTEIFFLVLNEEYGKLRDQSMILTT